MLFVFDIFVVAFGFQFSDETAVEAVWGSVRPHALGELSGHKPHGPKVQTRDTHSLRPICAFGQV